MSLYAKSLHDLAQARVQFHVLLTTYEMVVAEAAELRRIQWQTLVVDEAHRLRRSTSRCWPAQCTGRCVNLVLASCRLHQS